MDVKLPDGTIVTNAPEGMTQTELLARMGRAPEEPKERSLLGKLGRQAGLTMRHGLEGAGSVLALPSTLADAAAGAVNSTGLLPKIPKFNSMAAVVRLGDMLGLPKPEGAQERVVGDVAKAMAGVGVAGRVASAIAPAAGPVGQPILETIAANPALQQTAAAGGGLAGGVAREEGAGPLGQLGATLVGSVAAPMGAGLARRVGDRIADAGATIGASFGSQRGIERIAGEAARRVAGDSRQKIIDDAANATTYIEGAPPTIAEAIAQGQIGKAGQYGGATIKLQKDLTGAKGIEDILTGTARTQKAAVPKHWENLNTVAGPARERILADANAKGGVDPSKMISQIDDMLARADISEFSAKALSAVKDNISEKIGKHGLPDRVNADAIYATRKELGNTIGKFSKETNTWDKKVTGKLESDIQKLIDQSIKDAGGTRWREDYMDIYAAGGKAASDQLARQFEVKKIGASVKGSSAAELAAGELPKPPTLLSRPMMLINFGLKMISRDANTPVARELATRMQDPKEYAKLLALPATDPVRVQAAAIMRAAMLTAQQEEPETAAERRTRLVAERKSKE